MGHQVAYAPPYDPQQSPSSSSHVDQIDDADEEEYGGVVDDFPEEVGENNITEKEEPVQEEPDDADEVSNDVKTPEKRKRLTQGMFQCCHFTISLP